jgi:hypothetical protein
VTTFITVGDWVGFAVFVVVCLWAAVFRARELRRQSRCKHDGGIGETQDCHAHCLQCGKDLGFIGAWRARSAAKEE